MADERTAADVTAADRLGPQSIEGDPLKLIHTRESALDAPAIEVRGLRKVYPGGVEAVKGIDFEVASGEVFGLLGPNGAGKSTTLGMLTTTIVPTAGTARLAVVPEEVVHPGLLGG
jgi:ABC-type polysaccharide/polyol phosphate transport system ATPase subunit